uniref:Uncharacterized protein n=1 Tax=Mesocestoides corti TaxID=53468 RepID=A0A5K3EX13_MESCO
MLDHLASANPVTLCVPIACEEGLGYSTCGNSEGGDILVHASLSQSSVPLRSNGMRGRYGANQRKTQMRHSK